MLPPSHHSFQGEPGCRDVWPGKVGLTRVRLHVLIKVLLHVEVLATPLAHELLVADVDAHVGAQLVLVLEALVAVLRGQGVVDEHPKHPHIPLKSAEAKKSLFIPPKQGIWDIPSLVWGGCKVQAVRDRSWYWTSFIIKLVQPSLQEVMQSLGKCGIIPPAALAQSSVEAPRSGRLFPSSGATVRTLPRI